MNPTKKSIKLDVLGLPTPLLLILLVLLNIVVFYFVFSWLNNDEWKVFDSSQEYYTDEHPDFKLTYPPTWSQETYHGYYRGTKDIWVDFGDRITLSGLRIFWRPMNNPTINEMNSWGQEIIDRYKGTNLSQLQKINSEAEGLQVYKQSFHSRRTFEIVYIFDDTSGFILLFNGGFPENAENKKTFQKILDSFEIIER